VTQIVEEFKTYFLNLGKTDSVEILLKDINGVASNPNLIEKKILIDENLFYSLTSNLIHNAFEASASSIDKIIINIFEDKKNLCIGVFNTGEISKEIQKKLFKKFISSKKNGTGIGLYSARLIARAHGGDISYIPEKGGTRFVLKIPILN
jgi:signal transduction histidine kinase